MKKFEVVLVFAVLVFMGLMDTRFLMAQKAAEPGSTQVKMVEKVRHRSDFSTRSKEILAEQAAYKEAKDDGDYEKAAALTPFDWVAAWNYYMAAFHAYQDDAKSTEVDRLLALSAEAEANVELSEVKFPSTGDSTQGRLDSLVKKLKKVHQDALDAGD